MSAATGKVWKHLIRHRDRPSRVEGDQGEPCFDWAGHLDCGCPSGSPSWEGP